MAESGAGSDSPRPDEPAAQDPSINSAIMQGEWGGVSPPKHRPPRVRSPVDNYALGLDGYEGLLLHAISPSLAKKVYPKIATSVVERFVVAVLVVGTVVGTLPLLITSLHPSYLYLSAICFIPAFHRFALIDLRILRLLLRQVRQSAWCEAY